MGEHPDPPPGVTRDVVHTVDDWYDGPRAGVAEYGGALYWYRSVYLDDEDGDGRWYEYEDRFELTPVPAELLEWDREADDIFLRWDASRKAGEIEWDCEDVDAFGALPHEMERYRELRRRIHGHLAAHPPTLRVRGNFELGGRHVRWRPLGDDVPRTEPPEPLPDV